MKPLIAILLMLAAPCHAECVFGAKNKTSYTRLDSHTIMLTGGFGPDIIIKTLTIIMPMAEVRVLKDSFCSYETAVLYIDGEVVDVTQVTKVN